MRIKFSFGTGYSAPTFITEPMDDAAISALVKALASSHPCQRLQPGDYESEHVLVVDGTESIKVEMVNDDTTCTKRQYLTEKAQTEARRAAKAAKEAEAARQADLATAAN